MATFDLIDPELIRIGETATQIGSDVSPFITRMSVSLTMDASSELSFTVIDKDFIFAKSNFFQLRRNVYYRDLIFEISRVDVSQDQSSYPAFDIAARSKNIQLMKRDKEPEAFSGLSPTEFASLIASRFNMEFYGEETSEAKNIVKGASSRVDESTYDVLMRVAGENQFTMFETQNTLFFTSQENLLGKWGDTDYVFQDNIFIPLEWPSPSEELFPGAANKYRLIEMPSVGKSDDDWKLAEGSAVIDRINGVKLRPGMTINLSGIPDFEGLYLISAVEFDEGVPDPVRIQFRTPNDPDPARPGSGIGANGGVSTSGGGGSSQLPQDIASRITDYVQRYYPMPPIPPLANVTKAQFYSDEISGATNTALYHASVIWSDATGAAEVDTYIANFRTNPDNTKYKSVPYNAIRYVVSQLKSKFAPEVLQLPKTLKDDLSGEVTSLLGSSLGYVADTYIKNILATAQEVWSLTNVAAKNKTLDAALQSYGSSSIEYQVLTKFRARIIPTILDTFSGQFFPSTPI